MDFEFGPRTLVRVGKDIEVWVRGTVQKSQTIYHAQRRDGVYQDLTDLTEDEQKQMQGWIEEEIAIRDKALDEFKAGPFKDSLVAALSGLPPFKINVPSLGIFIEAAKLVLNELEG